MLSRAKGLSGPLERLVTQSGLKITVGTLVMASVLLGVRGISAGQVADLLHLSRAGRCAARSRVFHVSSCARTRTRRFEKFEEQFPEAIELMARALRAGHAFPTGMLMVAEEMPDPVGPEFKLVYDRQNFGMPLSDALKGLAERMPILDAGSSRPRC